MLDTRRLRAVTFDVMRAAGFRKFGWVNPSETLHGCSLSAHGESARSIRPPWRPLMATGPLMAT